MRMETSAKKQKQIDDFKASPLTIVETELAFNDIVDGKQRLGTIQDMHGNVYSDLPNNSQRMFTDNNCLACMEMEGSSDEQVIRQFLKMNHLGVPQSREHIEFVKSLNDSFRKE